MKAKMLFLGMALAGVLYLQFGVDWQQVLSPEEVAYEAPGREASAR